MHWLIPIFLTLVPAVSSAEEILIPKTFVNGEIADATDFNANNNYLIERIKESKTDIDELLANARWNNADEKGAVVKSVDCSANQSALIEAYHAHAHEDHLVFELTGSCKGAYRFKEYVEDNGEISVYQIQPKNQVVELYSDTSTNPSNRAKIIPRKLVADREYFLAGLVSSFGNGLYITNVDIEMGTHDSWGVLFSRNSNGALTDVSIKGAAEPSGEHDGVAIQNGASAYIGGSGTDSVIEGVDRGIMIRNEGFATVYGTLKIKAADIGVSTFSSGTFRLALSGDGKITAPTAINVNYGGLGYVDNHDNDVSIGGDISVAEASLSIRGGTILGAETEIQVFSGFFEYQNENSTIEANRLSCYGLSNVNVSGLSLTNNGGNGCVDNEGWNSLIESAFPSSSSSSMQKDTMARQDRDTKSAELPKRFTTPPAGRVDGELPW